METKPLDGITIVDFSRVLAAPMATQVLADLGATVIKIERPGTGDETRSFEPKLPSGDSAYFFAFNRGKQSVTLDLKDPADRDRALDLASRADVVVENFLPGTLDRLGLGYDTLSAANPGLIHLAATGFGQTGPARDKKGYDTIFQALSGVMHLTGHPDGDPAKTGIPVADMTSGLWVAIGILTGLVGRGRTGRGCYIDIAMMDVQVSLLALAAARVFALDEDPQRTGTSHAGRVPSAAFEGSDGRWLHISASDQHWPALCQALGLFDLAEDPELLSNAGRIARRQEVMDALRGAIADLPRDEVVSVLDGVGVPVGAVRSVKEVLADDQVQARGMTGQFDHPDAGSFPALRTPIRFRGYADPGFAAPPRLGEHNDRYLPATTGSTEEGGHR